MEQHGTNIKRYLDIAVRKWWLLVIPPLLGLGASFAYYTRAPKVYESSTMIEVQEQRIPEDLMAPTVTIDAEDRMNLILPILRSDGSIAAIAAETGLLRDGLGEVERRALFARLRASLDVVLDRRSQKYFTIRVEWPDRQVAARLAEAFSESFKKEHQNLRTEQAQKNLDFFRAEAEEAEANLARKQEEYSLFRRGAWWSLPENQDGVHKKTEENLREVESLNAEIRDHRQRIRELEVQIELARGAQTLRAEEPEHPDVVALREARRQLDEALLTKSESHPLVKRLRSRVELLETRVAEIEAPELAAGADAPDPKVAQLELMIEEHRAAIQVKEARKRRLEGERREFRGFINDSADVAVTDAEMRRELEHLQARYDAAKGKEDAAQKGVRLERSSEGESFRTLNPPGVPLAPIRPVLTQLLLVGFLGGLGVGVGVILLLEVFDQSYRSEDQLGIDFDLPILATIPNLDTSAGPPRESRRDRRRRRKAAAGRS